MGKTPEEILQESIIKNLEAKKLDSNIFEFFKTEIQNITEKSVLVKIADNIDTLKDFSFEEISAFITSTKEKVLGTIEDQDGVSEHKKAVCSNALEVMSHSIIVRAIKGFYRDKLNGETTNINELDDEEIEKYNIKYKDTKGLKKYGIEIFFAIENFTDFMVYLFNNNIFEKAETNYLLDKKEIVFSILSDLKEHIDSKDFFDLEKLKDEETLQRRNNLSIFNQIKIKEFFDVVDWIKFFDVVNWKKFFDVVNLKEFFDVVNLKEFFNVVDWKEFFEKIKIKSFLNYINCEININSNDDITINYKNKSYYYYKSLYINKDSLFMIRSNLNNIFKLDLKNGESKKEDNMPKGSLKIYDKNNGGFTEYYE